MSRFEIFEEAGRVPNRRVVSVRMTGVQSPVWQKECDLTQVVETLDLAAKVVQRRASGEIKDSTRFGTLMQLASDLGKARKAGDQDAIAKAQAAHDTYVDLVRGSQSMELGCRVIDLDRPRG